MQTNPIDQYHGDPTKAYLVAALSDRPAALEQVKTASFDAEAAAKLPAGAYAWPDAERYPVHTRADAIASIAYRSKYAGAVPRYVDEALADAVVAYGIDPDLFSSTAVKVAAAPVQYALPDHSRLPLGSAEQIKVAEEVLVRDGHVLPLEVRVAAFAKVAEAGRAAGVPLSAEAGAYAAENACNVHLLRDRVGMRAARTKVAMARGAYDELDAALAQWPARVTDREELLKLASRLHELDEAAGLEKDYGRKIFDPMKSIFNDPTVKLSADLTSDGMDVATLMALPPEVWEQVDAPEMAELAASGDAAQFKTVYETLPMDIKVVLKGQLPR